jgi:hypothetical protein
MAGAVLDGHPAGVLIIYIRRKVKEPEIYLAQALRARACARDEGGGGGPGLVEYFQAAAAA